MRSLGRAIKADSALEKNAERARQTRKATISQLSVASNYYHPLNPLPNQIDHLVTINFRYNLYLMQVMIALVSKPVKTYITVAAYY
jgi:hypothetical protein